jgi:protein O-mannosyl-transferase
MRFPIHPKRFALGLLAALILLTAFVFRQVGTYEFILFDDNVHLYENPGLINPSFEDTLQFWKRPYFGLYIPVTYSLWALETQLSRWGEGKSVRSFDPRVYHLTNLGLHLCNVILVYLLLCVWAPGVWGPLCGAALFAVHPLQVETVAWISARKDLLSTFFSLACLLLYLRDDSSKLFSRRYFFSFVCYGFALLSKPSAAVVPLLAVILSPQTNKRRAVLTLSWLFFAIPIILLTRTLQPDPRWEFVSPFLLRQFIAGDIIAFYLSKIVYPVGLVLDYSRSPEWVLQHWWGSVTWMFPVLLGALLQTYGTQRMKRAGLFFIVALLPVLGILPFRYQIFSSVANRYCYLALLAPALIMSELVAAYPKLRRGWGVVLACFVALTSVEIVFWRSSQSLFSHVLTINPRSLIAANNLGNSFERTGNLPHALIYYQKALALKPNWVDAKYNVAGVLAKQKRSEEAKSLLAEVLRADPHHPDAYFVLGMIELERENYAGAEANFSQAAHWGRRGKFLTKLGVSQVLQGKLKTAEATLNLSIAVDPHLPETYNDLGVVYLRQRRFSDAKQSFSTALSISPDYPEALRNLRDCFDREG